MEPDEPLHYPPFPGFGDTAPAPSGPIPASAPSPVLTPTAPLPAPAPATLDASASRRAGLSLLLAGAGLGTGALLGGLWGAGSGLLLAGSAMNAYRARGLWASDFADDRKEAVKTTVMAVLGLGLAGYLGYRAHERER